MADTTNAPKGPRDARDSLFDARDCGWCHGTGIHHYNTDDMDRLTMPCPNRNCPKSPDWWHAAAGANVKDRDPRLPPQGFAADTNPPYGDDSGPDDPDYEPIRLPWECVEDEADKRLSGMSGPFHARPRWQRVAWRLWRKVVLVRLLRREKWRYIVPPREIDQATMDAAIKRGRELAAKHGW